MEQGRIVKWEPEDFKLETTSVWRFPERGCWATHDGSYRGNWSPYIPRNLILRYTLPGDLLLDQFAGGGTTLVEAKLLGRNILGVDINSQALERCKEKCSFDYPNAGKVYLKKGDACNLTFIPNASVDFICTHPPYADIIRYSDDVENDISLLSEADFLLAMNRVVQECQRVLKPKKYCAVLMGDIRKKGYVIPLSFSVMQLYLQAGFKLKELIVKEQYNCRSTDYWAEKSLTSNFLLLAHEHLFIFEK